MKLFLPFQSVAASNNLGREWVYLVGQSQVCNVSFWTTAT